MAGASRKNARKYGRAAFSAGLAFALCVALFCCSPAIGRNPSGADLERIRRSPNYAGGKFQNQIPTPMFAEGTGFLSALFSGLFSPGANLKPDQPVPAEKTDFAAMPDDSIVWLGHSSWLLKFRGKTFLIDPVLDDYAAPLPIFNRAFKGSAPFTPADLPEIDYLLLTHDHWDHLEYPTLAALRSRIGKVVCPLGVGSHLRAWGYPPEVIEEKDWGEDVALAPGLEARLMPARHFSGRLLERDQTLWAGYALSAPDYRIFISGDSGYSPHFAEAGEAFDGFDLAILENGQYDSRWPHIHMFPEETAQAAADLRARFLLPAHNGKFAMARHAWDEPVKRLRESSGGRDYQLLEPVIGKIMPLPFDSRRNRR